MQCLTSHLDYAMPLLLFFIFVTIFVFGALCPKYKIA